MEFIGIFSLSIISPMGVSSVLLDLDASKSASEDSGSIARRSFFSVRMLFSISIE